MQDKKYNMVVESGISTVLAEYKPEKRNSQSYQSESELEKEFIENLKGQGYEYLSIHNPHDLEDNLRKQLQDLNLVIGRIIRLMTLKKYCEIQSIDYTNTILQRDYRKEK